MRTAASGLLENISHKKKKWCEKTVVITDLKLQWVKAIFLKFLFLDSLIQPPLY